MIRASRRLVDWQTRSGLVLSTGQTNHPKRAYQWSSTAFPDIHHDLAGKAIHIDGLRNVAITTGVQRPLFIALHDVRRQSNDRDVVEFGHLADVVCGGVSVSTRHIAVH